MLHDARLIASTTITRRVLRALVETRRLKNLTLTKAIANYVINRQNEDGGYTFCQGAESNAQDTYYGLSILNLLGQSFPHAEKTVRFLNDFRINTIYSTYYVIKAQLLLGNKNITDFKEHLRSILVAKHYFGSTDVFSEVSSEFTTTFMVLELASQLGLNFETEKVAKWLLQFSNKDGGFGAQGQSNINSTYYALASLSLMNQNLKDLREALAFVRACEKPYGGFTVVPMNFAPYMEHTYYGVMTLALYDEAMRYPSQTIDFVLKCQNKNGGFARSDVGISTFENTFQAVRVLQRLGFKL